MEPGNPCDEHAVAVLNEREIVGHVPYNYILDVSKKGNEQRLRESYLWKSEQRYWLWPSSAMYNQQGVWHSVRLICTVE